jgi:creatinine amidohydrolase
MLAAMRIRDLNWMQLEAYLEHDDRIVLPLGSTEEHAYISLETDNILAERVSQEAAEPLGIPVLPVLAYGVTPRFAAYPGSPSVSQETYAQLLSELTGSLRGQGFGRILLVNGHGGNSFAAERVAGDGVRWHDWWRSERIRALVDEIDPEASHASWMETFPWTRLEGVALPEGHKGTLDLLDVTDPEEFRRVAGDGSFGGFYERPDKEMLRIWEAAVDEVRALLEWGWGS